MNSLTQRFMQQIRKAIELLRFLACTKIKKKKTKIKLFSYIRGDINNYN